MPCADRVSPVVQAGGRNRHIRIEDYGEDDSGQIGRDRQLLDIQTYQQRFDGQAYGFRDREYFKLKIYQLPEISCERTI